MSLLGEVEAARKKSRPGIPCVVERVRGELEGEDLDEFEVALAGDRGKYPSTAITTALRGRGFHVARGAIDRHRNEECRCYSGGE